MFDVCTLQGVDLPLGCINDANSNRSTLYMCTGTHGTYQEFDQHNCAGTPLLQQITASGECGVTSRDSSYRITCATIGGNINTSGAAGLTMSIFALVLVAVSAVFQLRA